LTHPAVRVQAPAVFHHRLFAGSPPVVSAAASGSAHDAALRPKIIPKSSGKCRIVPSCLDTFVLAVQELASIVKMALVSHNVTPMAPFSVVFRQFFDAIGSETRMERPRYALVSLI